MDFYKFLKEKKVVIFDGAMGTQLAKRGLVMSGTNNIENPKQVREIHQEYINAGADVVITNTLTMNRISLESHGIHIDLDAVNLAGARLAKQAASSEQYVFGDIGPTGQLMEPLGEYTEEQFYNNFKEQATCLAKGGVDGFIIETITNLQEAVCALKACKAAAALPVIVSFSFSTNKNGGRTIMGNSVAEIAKMMEQYGADAVGANCGELDPEELAEIAWMFKEITSLPIIIQPNAGKPQFKDNQTTFAMKPEAFADGVIKCIENGASMVGGCCGTSSDHIRAIAERISRHLAEI